MSWNGSGSFNRLFSWVADKAASIDISSSRMDSDTNDITSNGFGNCLTRDGQGSATANLPMNTFKFTGLGNGSARTDSNALGQVQDGLINWVAAGGLADAITATYSPALTALVDGQLCFIRVAAANATTTPTFAPNSLPAHTITKLGGNALVAGDIIGNLAEVILRYNLANTRWELLNPSTAVIPNTTVTNAELFTMNAWTLKGNNSGSSANPTDFTIDALTAKASPLAADEVPIWDAAGAAMKKATLTSLAAAISKTPTVQLFTSGTSLTYTPPAGMVRIRVRMCGGGAGGGAQSTNNGSNGNTTSFGSWSAAGGSGGLAQGGAGGAGGTGGANGTGGLIVRLTGGAGQGGTVNTATITGVIHPAGGQGGANPFGGGGRGASQASPGGDGSPSTGGGGGGGGGDTQLSSGGGGGGGEYVEFYMTAAAVGASQTYTVGAGAGGGAAGGQAGGNGAAGVIIIEEFYI